MRSGVGCLAIVPFRKGQTMTIAQLAYHTSTMSTDEKIHYYRTAYFIVSLPSPVSRSLPSPISLGLPSPIHLSLPSPIFLDLPSPISRSPQPHFSLRIGLRLGLERVLEWRGL